MIILNGQKYYGILLKQLTAHTFAVTNITIPGWIDIIHDPRYVRATYKIKWIAPWKEPTLTVNKELENFKKIEYRFRHI